MYHYRTALSTAHAICCSSTMLFIRYVAMFLSRALRRLEMLVLEFAPQYLTPQAQLSIPQPDFLAFRRNGPRLDLDDAQHCRAPSPSPLVTCPMLERLGSARHISPAHGPIGRAPTAIKTPRSRGSQDRRPSLDAASSSWCARVRGGMSTDRLTVRCGRDAS